MVVAPASWASAGSQRPGGACCVDGKLFLFFFRASCELSPLCLLLATRVFPNCTAKPKGERQMYVGDMLLDCKEVSQLTLRRPYDRVRGGGSAGAVGGAPRVAAGWLQSGRDQTSAVQGALHASLTTHPGQLGSVHTTRCGVAALSAATAALPGAISIQSQSNTP